MPVCMYKHSAYNNDATLFPYTLDYILDTYLGSSQKVLIINKLVKAS